jgi:hypothetical protein
MGEVIAFKRDKNGAHPRRRPEGTVRIVTFTGGLDVPVNARKNAPALEKAAWFERRGNRIFRFIGRVGPWIAASLRGIRNRSCTKVEANQWRARHSGVLVKRRSL